MIHHGDCLEVMAQLPEASVDAIVCDPPYGLEFMGKEWDRLAWRRDRQPDTTGRGSWFGDNHDSPRYGVASPAMQQWHQRWATEALRVAKPGAYLLAFGGTRTFHRLACAIEDAGWIIRDTLVWAYAQGFPKSRALLKPAWEPIVMARKPGPLRELAIDACRIPTEMELRREKAGWQTDYVGGEQQYVNTFELHPEPLAGRWPANVILTDPIFDGGVEGVVGGTQHGIIAACPACGAPPAETSSIAAGPTVESSALGLAWLPPSAPSTTARSAASEPTRVDDGTAPSDAPTSDDGRAASTGSDGIRHARHEPKPELSASERRIASEPSRGSTFLSEPPARSAVPPSASSATTTTTPSPWTCGHSASDAITASTPASTGGYSRFFLLPKSARAEREPVFGGLEAQRGGAEQYDSRWKEGTGALRMPTRRNVHPTVKPLDLMRHLVRLVTPVGGTVLDCFAGSGTTLIAAEMEGFQWIGIEREREYVDIIEARLQGVQRGLGLDVPAPTPRNPGPTGEESGKARRSYGRAAFGGLTTGLFTGHPPKPVEKWAWPVGRPFGVDAEGEDVA